MDEELSELEQAILEFERQHFKYAGAKEAQIADVLELSPIRYYQILNRLLDSQAALAAYPQVIHRLRRMRQERLSQRRI